MRIWISTFVLFCCTASYAEVYTWTDSNGVVHFSDRPASGAKRVELPAVQSYTSPPASTLLPTPKLGPTEATQPVGYDSLQIVDPPPNTTFRNVDGNVSVSVNIRPDLHEGDRIQLLLDGTVLGQPQRETAFLLTDLDRGEHQIVAQVVNGQGSVMKSSEPLSLYMMQPRVGMSGPKTP